MKYNEFLLESMINEGLINEAFDFNVLKNHLSKLSKDKVVEYYYKIVDKLMTMPKDKRDKLMTKLTSIILMFVTIANISGIGARSIDIDTAEYVDNFIKMEYEGFEELDSDNKGKLSKTLNKKASFDIAQEKVEIAEGGYTDDKDDSGNYVDGILIGTNYGISAPVLKDYLGKTPTVKDMKNLSMDVVLKIYKKNYWNKYNLGTIENQSVADIIYDGLVNQGSKGMYNVIRKALSNMEIDEVDIWDNISNINSLDSEELFNEIKKERRNRYKKTKKFKKYGNGWLSRLDSIKFNEKN